MNNQKKTISNNETFPNFVKLPEGKRDNALPLLLALAEELKIDLVNAPTRTKRRTMKRRGAVNLVDHPTFTTKKHSSVLTSLPGGVVGERNKIIFVSSKKSAFECQQTEQEPSSSHQPQLSNNNHPVLSSLIENSRGAWSKRSSHQ